MWLGDLKGNKLRGRRNGERVNKMSVRSASVERV